MKSKVLVVDDDESIRSQMKWALSDEYEIVTAGDRETALERFRVERPAVTLLDLGLPPCSNGTEEGMAILAGIAGSDPGAKVIIMSGQSDRQNAIRAVGAGAHDFVCKPVDVEELKVTMRRCVFVSALEREYREMQRRSETGAFEGIVGACAKMQEVFRTITKVAPSQAPVLVLGESGTGKEMVAHAIHNRSQRRDGPFVAINCSAIPESLLESELFGHEKGAFTGAHAQRIGWIESADGGTLFLDEIGELPGTLQVKLLRFLQEKRIQRVGGRKEIEVDVRVVAATHVDLEGAIRTGNFREDLYFRLAVVVCRLPALRDRDDDAVLLAKDFLRRSGAQNGRPDLGFDPRAIAAIRKYHWPGNVRELQNRVLRAVIMAESRNIGTADLELPDEELPPPVATLREARESLERDMVLRALKRNECKVTAAAKELGVSRPTFYELMTRLGITKR